ncbi:hypothetical protein [Metamycoplasma equirhinis]|uniref:hypothetical protein n=1 Tax=Metamycoplasma equirhinis TaxID=92402 RepID=UPI003594003C
MKVVFNITHQHIDIVINYALKNVETPKTRDLNLEYSPNLVFRALLNSKTFAYFPNTWIGNWNYSFLMFNPKSLTRSWNIIFKEVALDKDSVKKLYRLQNVLTIVIVLPAF